MLCTPQQALKNVILFAASFALPTAASAMTVGNPLCPGEEVLFNPDNGQDIVVPEGFKVSVFASGLNFPTGIAFRGDAHRFEVYVLESGVFPTSRCNDGVAWQTKGLPGNPFTSDIRVFDQNAKLLRTLGKPPDATTDTPGAFGPGQVVDTAFEHGFARGALVRDRQRGKRWTHRYRRPDDRESCPAHNRAPRRPDRTAGVSRRLDLLGRWRYDE